jgi:hypothetical protein
MKMKKLDLTMCLVVCGLLLAGCGGYRSPKQGSMRYSKRISKPGDNVLYEAIDLEYWLDNVTGKPAVVIVSFRTSSSPFGQLIGHSCGFKNGRCKYFQLQSDKSKRDIPFIEEDLISSDEVPVYYAVDNPGIAKTILTFDEFERLQTAVEKKDFLEAKHIITKRTKENTSYF